MQISNFVAYHVGKHFPNTVVTVDYDGGVYYKVTLNIFISQYGGEISDLNCEVEYEQGKYTQMVCEFLSVENSDVGMTILRYAVLKKEAAKAYAQCMSCEDRELYKRHLDNFKKGIQNRIQKRMRWTQRRNRLEDFAASLNNEQKEMYVVHQRFLKSLSPMQQKMFDRL